MSGNGYHLKGKVIKMDSVELYDSKYRWINVHGDCQCPDCGYIAEAWWLKEAVSGEDLAPHCPSCGADMRLQ